MKIKRNVISDKWSTRHPLPIGIADAPAVSCNGAIFIFGGYSERPDDIKNCVLEYSPVDDAWSFKSPMLKARWGSAASICDRQVYVFGGVIGRPRFHEAYLQNSSRYGWRTTGIVERYNIAEDKWITLRTPLPDALHGHGLMAATVGSEIYLFNEASTCKYDPSNDSYERRADAPVPRRWATCGHVETESGDRIYIIGGFDSNTREVTNVNYCYLPDLDKWVGPKTPAPYSALGVTRDDPVWRNEIYYGFGHQKPDSFYGDIYRYSPDEDCWTGSLSKAFFARDGVACATADNGLYVIGGRNEPNDALASGLIYNERFQLEAGYSDIDSSNSVEPRRLDKAHS